METNIELLLEELIPGYLAERDAVAAAVGDGDLNAIKIEATLLIGD